MAKKKPAKVSIFILAGVVFSGRIASTLYLLILGDLSILTLIGM